MTVGGNTTNIKEQVLQTAHTLRRYTVVIFLLFMIGIYGFLTWRAVTLNQVEPDEAEVTAQLQTAGVPAIDQGVVDKIEQLQDNSVSVQSLFDEARRNPFQE